MFNLSSFLEKFKHLKDPKENKEKIVAIINQETKLTLTSSQILFDRGIVRIQALPLQNQIVFMKKELLIKIIQDELPDLRITQIL